MHHNQLIFTILQSFFMVWAVGMLVFFGHVWGHSLSADRPFWWKVSVGMGALLAVLLLLAVMLGIAGSIIVGCVYLMITFLTPALKGHGWDVANVSLLEVAIIGAVMYAVVILFPKIVYLIPSSFYKRCENWLCVRLGIDLTKASLNDSDR
jgi:hypothetical protein